MEGPMASELNVLAAALNRLSEHDPRTRDFTLNSLRDALREVVACFPVYRTYVSAAGADDRDRRTIDTALARTRRRHPTMEPSIFAFMRGMLLPDPADAEPRPAPRLRHELPAVHRPGAGQGPRGHRLLPLRTRWSR